MTSTQPQKTPLEKTLDDQKSLLSFLEEDLPAELSDFQNRTFAVIDTYFDGTDTHKEALKIGVVVMMSPPFLLDDVSRFESYGPDYIGIINELQEVSATRPPTHNAARAALAAGFVLLEETLKKVQFCELPLNDVKAMHDAALQDDGLQTARTLESANCPAFTAAYNALEQKLNSAIADHLNAKPGPAPRSPQP